jgi:hypothetical protein
MVVSPAPEVVDDARSSASRTRPAVVRRGGYVPESRARGSRFAQASGALPGGVPVAIVLDLHGAGGSNPCFS